MEFDITFEDKNIVVVDKLTTIKLNIKNISGNLMRDIKIKSNIGDLSGHIPEQLNNNESFKQSLKILTNKWNKNGLDLEIDVRATQYSGE